MQSLLYYFEILSAAAVEKGEDEACMTAESDYDIGLLLSLISLRISVTQRHSKTDCFF